MVPQVPLPLQSTLRLRLACADNEISATNWLLSSDSDWDLAVVDLHFKKGSSIGSLNSCTTRRPEQWVLLLSGELTGDFLDALEEAAGWLPDDRAYVAALWRGDREGIARLRTGCN